MKDCFCNLRLVKVALLTEGPNLWFPCCGLLRNMSVQGSFEDTAFKVGEC